MCEDGRGPKRSFKVSLASETPWTKETWVYDLRTNKHFTLRRRSRTRADLDDFVACYSAKDRTQRVGSGRGTTRSRQGLPLL